MDYHLEELIENHILNMIRMVMHYPLLLEDIHSPMNIHLEFK